MTETPAMVETAAVEPARPAAGIVWLAVFIDVVIVAFFAVYGRISHGMSLDLAEVARVAWPFFVGLAIAWLLFMVWNRPLAPLRSGIPITLITVVVGMVLRYAVAYQGEVPVSWPFVIVTTSLFAVLFIGWRGIAALILRRRSRWPGEGNQEDY